MDLQPKEAAATFEKIAATSLRACGRLIGDGAWTHATTSRSS